MGTAEIIIVFSALMALIALVTIGIDWIGKPLKHRRFIPRMYRFDDEKLPVDEYGNPIAADLVDPNAVGPSPMPAPFPYVVPYPMNPGSAPTPQAPLAPQATSGEPNPTIVVPVQPAPRQVAQIDTVIAASAPPSRSAFTDSLTASDSSAGSSSDLGDDQAAFPGHSVIAGTTSASVAVIGDRAWTPGMALDMTVDDLKPSLAIKAERFWKAAAEATANSHFGQDDIDRMAAGKAPRRTNPRTGRPEAMQLTGLRQASTRDDVRMRWPEDAIDPWSSS